MLEIVKVALKAEKILEKQKQWKMKRIVYIISQTEQAATGAVIEDSTMMVACLWAWAESALTC